MLVALVFGAAVSIGIGTWAVNTERGTVRWMRTPASSVIPTWSVQVFGYRLLTSASFYPPKPAESDGAEIEAAVGLLPDADLRRFTRPLLRTGSSRVHVYSAGWPLQCVAGSEHALLLSAKPSKRAVARTDVSWRAPWLGSFDVPTRLLWRNLAADSALFGAPLFLILMAVAPLRRWRRRRRGWCPQCRYDLRHDLNAGCPECGWGRKPERAPA